MEVADTKVDLIYHMVADDKLPELALGIPYAPASFLDEGFVHCSATLGQLLRVANRFYASEPGTWSILVIRTETVRQDLRWEEVDGEIFPHIYAPLVNEDVAAIDVFPRLPDGTFKLRT